MSSAGCSPSPLQQRIFRFGVSGVLVTGVHFLIAVLLIKGARLPPSGANGLAFTAATGLSYLLNTLWSFSGTLRGRTLLRFLLVAAFGLLLTMAVSWTAQQLGLNYLLGIVAVAVTVPAASFLLHNTWTYRA